MEKSMQKTLVIFKPSSIQRGLVGEIISRFEKKGLQIVGIKMINLSDEILNAHYAHLIDKPFFGRIKRSMQSSPVIVMAVKGFEAVKVVRKMTGSTNAREAEPGTIRGDYSVSMQENIIHTSDSEENVTIELNRFFNEDELYDFPQILESVIYSDEENR